ncbi:MAG: tyrosine-type recombinase/integrase [Gammaproteobacteria bacterium]|nr:tyrosine-type recombinase/integrase [Gammaproteobacteria bacterium]
MHSPREWINTFHHYLYCERQYSPLTCQNHQSILHRAWDFLSGHPGVDNWHQVTAHHLQRYLSYCYRRSLKAASIATMLSSIRCFYDYLLGHCDHLSHNPARLVSPPKQSARPLPGPIPSIDDMNRLLKPGRGDSVEVIRNLAMFELIYSSALRVSELINIDINDIDLRTGNVIVTGKGNKTRYLPVGRQAVRAVQRYLKVRLDSTGSSQPLFVSDKGGRFTVNMIEWRLSTHKRQCGLDIPLTPHRLRHASATYFLESSGDLPAVQALLGHSDIATTEIYTHLSTRHIKATHLACHPRAKRRSKKD